MGGDSKQTTTQQSQTQPWAPAQPFLNGILGQLQNGLGSTGLTGAETGALNTITQNATTANRFAPQIGDYASSLLAGGGANAQAGNVQSGYDRFVNQTNPLASNTNYNPYDTAGFKDAINTAISDVTNSTNGAFAAAGRDFSGANSQALGRGIMQGVAPTIAAQYNQNVQNQQGAAGNLYNASNANAGLLSGMQQQFLQNQGAGIDASGKALDAQNNGANSILQAEAMRRNIPVQSLGLLANIGIPIAGLGSQSNGTSTSTYSPSLLQQVQGWTGVANGLFGGGGSNGVGTLAAMSKFISDRNAKDDIAQVGALFDGTPVYRYRYKGDHRFQIGLMAQDVEKYAPEAVGRIGPWKAVDYKLATDKALEVA